MFGGGSFSLIRLIVRSEAIVRVGAGKRFFDSIKKTFTRPSCYYPVNYSMFTSSSSSNSTAASAIDSPTPGKNPRDSADLTS